MIRNYIKIAWRNLKRHKGYSAINVIGLALSIACCIIIFTIVSFHLSFDNFHPDKGRIYRLVTEWHDQQIDRSSAVPQPLGKAYRTDFDFSEKTARVVSYRNTLITIPEGNKKFNEERGIVYTEPEYFDIFNYPLVSGNKQAVLREPNEALITQNTALKYFGKEDPVGKTIRINNSINFIIKGVLKDIPANTDRRHEIYVSYHNLKDHNRWLASDSSWGGVYSGSQCYTLLKPNITKAQVERGLQSIVDKNYEGREQKTWKFKIQPLPDIHFNADFDGAADKRYLWALTTIAVLLMLTACVNFINLATAQALNRAKEIGVRKVLGGLRSQLFWQFIVETAIITISAMVVGYVIAEFVMPHLNTLFETEMQLRLFSDYKLPAFLILSALIIIFLSGSYPGLILARFQPVLALKSKLSQSHIGGFSLRRILVVAQFAISQMLIIGTIVIAAQMNYSKTKDLGFSPDSIVMLPSPTGNLVTQNTFRDRISKIPGVEKLSYCYQAPAAASNSNTSIRFESRQEDEHWNVNMKQGDDKYLSTFNLQLIAGRNFFPSDTTREFVVNETLVKKLGFTDPNEVLGKMISINGATITAPIVGVVRDFYNYSLRSEIAAICIMPDYDSYQQVAVKINTNNMQSTLGAMEKIWNETFPDYLYSHQFVDERIAEFYRMDTVMFTLIRAFSFIAIFIGCMGLYGLVSFMAVRKTKEIGVRKVLGADVGNILWLFGREFSRLLIIAFVIAAPVAWWAMHKYLEDYEYRIDMGIGIFLLAIVITVLIAAVTVGYRSVKAAVVNPVKSLRTE